MFTHIGSGPGTAVSNLTLFGDLDGIAFFFGTAMYSFEGIGVVSIQYMSHECDLNSDLAISINLCCLTLS